MLVFDYKLFQSEDADGNPILATITMKYTEENVELAKERSYDGEVSEPYDNGQPEPEPTPSGDDSAVWDELDAAYQEGVDNV